MTGSQHLSQAKKIVFVTDVPCWRQRTGAQQRIMALARFLVDQGFLVSIVYLGSFAHEQSVDFGGNNRSLAFVSLIDHWKPTGFIDAAIWKLKCIGNSLSPKSTEQSASQSKRISSFANPMFRQRFRDYLRDEKPEIVIVEYVTLSYLVPPVGQRTGIQYWVDTHDWLSSRCSQFKELGLPHWIDISESEEAAALKQFDGIIAIESSEADQFRTLTQNRIPVVVAGHAAQAQSTRTLESSEEKIGIGIIASDNQINRIEIEWFLQEVWPKVIQSSGNQSVHLVLAGDICNSLAKIDDLQNVRLIGAIGNLADFYDQIQFAINPIRFGAGLKIKSVEALGFGKPLVAAPHSIAGLPSDSTALPFIAADSADEMAAAILKLASERKLLKQMTDDAVYYTERLLSPEAVYGPILEKIRESYS